jgi:hypothetical protein
MTRSRGTRRTRTHSASRIEFLSTNALVDYTGETNRSKAYDDPDRRTFRYAYRINGPKATPVKTSTYNDLPPDSVLRR